RGTALYPVPPLLRYFAASSPVRPLRNYPRSRCPMKIYFSAGEPSGDLHGANLIRQLRNEYPELEAVGYGGPEMAAADCQLHTDMTKLAVMWVLRVILNIHKFLALAGRADRYFRHHRPDAVVLVD